MKFHNDKRNIKQSVRIQQACTCLHKITWPQYIESKTNRIGKTKSTVRMGYFSIPLSKTKR